MSGKPLHIASDESSVRPTDVTSTLCLVEAPGIPDGVGWTSLTTLAQRAAESLRPNALFTDPLAVAVMEALPTVTKSALIKQAQKESEGTLAFLRGFVPIRTDYLDRALLEATAKGIDQVVVFGAGLDGRGYRLSWPNGVHLYELDLIDVIDYKREVARQAGLTETAVMTVVSADLREEWSSVLVSAGFTPGRPVVWLLEGLLNYLPSSAADGLLTTLSSLSCPRSHLIATYLDPAAEAALAAVASTSGDESAGKVASLRADGPPAPPHEWLPQHCWEPKIVTVDAWARRLQRDCPPVLDPNHGGGTCWMFTADRANPSLDESG